MARKKVAARPDFVVWLDGQLNDRGWSRSELARRAGVSSSTVDRIVTDYMQPTPVTLQGLSRALNVPQEEVYRRAGMLPAISGRDEVSQLSRRLMRLPAGQLSRVMAVIGQILDIAERAPGSPQFDENVPVSQRRKPAPASSTSTGRKDALLELVRPKLEPDIYEALVAMIDSDTEGGKTSDDMPWRIIE